MKIKLTNEILLAEKFITNQSLGKSGYANSGFKEQSEFDALSPWLAVEASD
jgi:hypothetical protein